MQCADDGGCNNVELDRILDTEKSGVQTLDVSEFEIISEEVFVINYSCKTKWSCGAVFRVDGKPSVWLVTLVRCQGALSQHPTCWVGT